MINRMLLKALFCSGFLSVAWVAPVQAVPQITLANGVSNAPASVTSTGLTPTLLAVADTAALAPVANFSNLLQATLNGQGFTAGNNWTLVTNQVPLDNTATFNLTAYNLSFAANVFTETMNFTLAPNPAAPAAPAGSTVTEHWLQFWNENQQYGGLGVAIAGQPGFWQLDNGVKTGGAAAGAATGPYYDSNPPAGGGTFSTPPGFHDAPQLSNVGYLHFIDIPTWDIFTPGAAGKPATETIDVASYGISYGFTVTAVPLPSTFLLFISAILGLVGNAYQRKIKA